jgi:hypothetical protein
MADYSTELELIKLRVTIMEQQMIETKADIHKILAQSSAIKWTLFGVILAVSPQSVSAVMDIVTRFGN